MTQQVQYLLAKQVNENSSQCLSPKQQHRINILNAGVKECVCLCECVFLYSADYYHNYLINHKIPKNSENVIFQG